MVTFNRFFLFDIEKHDKCCISIIESKNISIPYLQFNYMFKQKGKILNLGLL